VVESLENSAFSQWVLGSDSLLAYPTILTLHTVGLGLVVGTALIFNLRVMGFGAEIAIANMRNLVRIFWIGFAINLASGLILFAAEASKRAPQTVFYIKLGLIAAAIILTLRLRTAPEDGRRDSGSVRLLAGVALVLWAGAIVAGRLMAYL
jgi:hypothetical protein